MDKIIIAQDSLRDFINTLSPGAYSSMTKVNFHALDKLLVQPIGIYGSKVEIARFLLAYGVIDALTSALPLPLCNDNAQYLPRSQKMLKPQHSGKSEPVLRSGLYVVRSLNAATTENQLYVVYWPQDTTWNDNALSAVRRNRVTFMWYVNYICVSMILTFSGRAGI